MTDEARLQRWSGSHRGGGGHLAAAHVDVDTLTHYAFGQLSPADASFVDEHLAVCEDGRCPEFVRSQSGQPEGSSDWVATSEAVSTTGTRPRTFRSREIIWATFESMARELDVPIDDLVNEAMAAYAEARGYARGAAPRSADVDDLALTGARPGAQPRDAARPPVHQTTLRTAPALEPAPAARGERSVVPRSPPARPAPLPSRPAAPPARPAPPPVRARPLPPPAPPRMPPPDARQPAFSSRPPMPPMTQRLPPPDNDRDRGRPPPPSFAEHEARPSSTRRLVLEYQGGVYPVEKERFLIGRSKTQADLRLDDPNVSRQHAVIERVGAAWYIVDLGSTNGILIAGERVARRALTDGDLIVITTHEIRVTLR